MGRPILVAGDTSRVCRTISAARLRERSVSPSRGLRAKSGEMSNAPCSCRPSSQYRTLWEALRVSRSKRGPARANAREQSDDRDNPAHNATMVPKSAALARNAAIRAV